MKTTTDGMIAFYISVRVDVAAMKDWEPERITAFFAGIAQAKAAADADDWHVSPTPPASTAG